MSLYAWESDEALEMAYEDAVNGGYDEPAQEGWDYPDEDDPQDGPAGEEGER